MTARVPALFATVFAAILASGCEAIGTIFKAGVWTGVIAVVVVVGLIAFVVMRAGRS
jgi:hypothetical protein